IFAFTLSASHLRSLSAAAAEETRAPQPVQFSFFYLCAIVLAALKLAGSAHIKSELVLISQIVIGATLFFLDGTVVYLVSTNDEYVAALERTADGRVVCPEMKASLYARLSYSYINPLLEEAVRAPLENSDIWDLNPIDDARNIEAEFARIRSTGKSLKWALISYIRPFFFVQLGFALVALPAQFLGPYMLNRLVGYVKDPTTATKVGAFGFVFIMLGASIVRTVCENTAYFYSRRSSVRASVSLISEIYRHSLQRVFGKKTVGEDGKVEKDTGLGKIVTLMSSDAMQVSECVAWLYM
ncbi:hypothetical protein BDK51DRAFT_38320, partial [Blyttiomyces helicus]